MSRNVITLNCPPYETLFGNDHVFCAIPRDQRISGFYKAFRMELSETSMSNSIASAMLNSSSCIFLPTRNPPRTAKRARIVVDAQKKFVKNHIGR